MKRRLGLEMNGGLGRNRCRYMKKLGSDDYKVEDFYRCNRFVRKILKYCENKPVIKTDRRPWYRYTTEIRITT